MWSNKLRPKSIDNLVGNTDIIKSFKVFKKEVPHFIIINGPTGTGKTTSARILANEFLGGYEEINASNHNGVDDFRQIIEDCKYRPLNKKYKVYIFDEAHQITNQAQNCLLNFLENMPSYVYIIFCTTEINKILLTVRRRACILETKKLSAAEIKILLNNIRKDIAPETSDEDLDKLYKTIIEDDVKSPGLIVQYFENFVNGSGYRITEVPGDTFMEFARSFAAGNVEGCVKYYNRDDFGAHKKITLQYMYKVLLDKKSVKVAKAIKSICKIEDPIEFLATVVVACHDMSK
jgi:adenylate kinase family enzyme